MLKVCMSAVLATMLCGCAAPTATWKGTVEWPDAHSRKSIVPFTEAGTALAAAAAIREMVANNPHPDLFSGCSSPEQGLDVAVQNRGTFLFHVERQRVEMRECPCR